MQQQFKAQDDAIQKIADSVQTCVSDLKKIDDRQQTTNNEVAAVKSTVTNLEQDHRAHIGQIKALMQEVIRLDSNSNIGQEISVISQGIRKLEEMHENSTAQIEQLQEQLTSATDLANNQRTQLV